MCFRGYKFTEFSKEVLDDLEFFNTLFDKISKKCDLNYKVGVLILDIEHITGRSNH